MATPLTRRRFTADEYQALGRAGILRDERVELLEGEIVTMSPIGSRHSATVAYLDRRFQKSLGNDALVFVQNPVRLDRYSEPQPDLSILRKADDFYAGGHPGPADVLLLVEVAGSSAEYDCTVKARLYAEASIAETWIVLLDSRTVRVLRDPSPDGYRDVKDLKGGAPLSPLAFPDVAFTADALFPPFEG